MESLSIIESIFVLIIDSQGFDYETSSTSFINSINIKALER